MKAAEYGQSLLERVQELEQILEETTQSRHELNMKLESKQVGSFPSLPRQLYVS